MDVRAAVAVAAGKPLEITTVQLEGPREGEVLVEIKATGVCHTDNSRCPAPIPKDYSRRFSATRVRAWWSISAAASPV
jgi:Zn-dependent alcohol dehydrogenase